MKRQLSETTSRNYDRRINLPVIRNIRAAEDAVISRLFHERVQSTDSILEIGAGTGYYTLKFAAAANMVTAVDLSPAMVEHLRNKAKGQNLFNIKVITSDFLHYNDSTTYDWVIAVGVLEYPQDPWEFLNKLISFSNKWVLVTFPTQGIWGKTYRLTSHLRGSHVSLFTKSEIHDKYSSSIVHLEDVGLKSPVTRGLTLICLLE